LSLIGEICHPLPRTEADPSSHRLKTVADADVIIVLKDGFVAEQGTHGELLAKGGIYKGMWDQQNAALE
jgi:ABC-type multidrug transport system fused ATPase/permease subunit